MSKYSGGRVTLARSLPTRILGRRVVTFGSLIPAITYTMKRLSSLALLAALGTALGAQSFEWDTPRSAVPAHPKEVVIEQEERGTAGVYSPEQQGKPTAYGEIYDGTEMTGSHPILPLGTLLKVTNTDNGRSVTVRVTDQGKECADCLITLSEVAARELGIAERGTVHLERSGFSNWNPLPPDRGQTQKSGIVAPQPRSELASAPRPLLSQPKIIEREITSPPSTSGADMPLTFARRVEVGEQQPTVAPPAPTVGTDQQARSVRLPANPSTTAPGTAYAVQLAAYTNEAYALRRVNELKEQGLADVYYRAITKSDGQVINRVYAGAFLDVDAAQQAAREIQGKFNIAGIVAKM